MTAIPSQVLPLPATDATVTVGLPEAGLSTRLDPSTAITQGTIGGRKFGARVMNWILGGFGDWIAYLREANGDRLTDTPRNYCIPTALVAELNHVKSSFAFDVYNPSGLLGVNIHQPVVMQNISTCVFSWQISDILPRDGILDTLIVMVMADPGWSSLPTNLGDLTVIAVAEDGTETVISSTAVDPSATVAAFRAPHQIILTGLNIDLDQSGKRIYAHLQGAINASWLPVYYFNLSCTVKAKPW